MTSISTATTASTTATFNGKVNFNDIDWKNVDRSKLNIDRSQLNKFDRNNIRERVKADGGNAIRDRAANIRERGGAGTLAGRASKVSDVRKSTLEGLKNRPGAGGERPNIGGGNRCRDRTSARAATDPTSAKAATGPTSIVPRSTSPIATDPMSIVPRGGRSRRARPDIRPRQPRRPWQHRPGQGVPYPVEPRPPGHGRRRPGWWASPVVAPERRGRSIHRGGGGGGHARRGGGGGRRR